jgi:hypothetical protein
MANNYKKFTPADFKEKLKEGGYAAAVGARRAIGKFADWSDEDKDKARRAVDAHFGEEGGSTQKKAAKKAPAKRAGKKAARKAAAAPAKKAAKKAAASAPAKRGRKPRAVAAATAPQASSGPGRKATKAAGFGGDTETVDRMTRVIGTMSDAVNSIRLAREMATSDPKELDEALLTATRTIARALTVLDEQVSTHLRLTGKKAEVKVAATEPTASEPKPRTLKDVIAEHTPTEEEQREAEALSHAVNSTGGANASSEPEVRAEA